MIPDEHSGQDAGADVFISYSRRDGDFVRRLYDALEAHGRTCWVDWEGIPPSAKWMEEVRGAIGASQAFVFVISPDSIVSEVCREELEYAASLNKRIIPIVAADPPSADAVPEAATVRNWLFFRESDDFDAALRALEETLDTDPDWARRHTRLSVRAVEWDANERDPSFALRGRDLTAAESWLTEADERKDPQPTQLHTEYIVASRQAATRSQRRRMAALGVALVVSSALAVAAFLQFRRAEDEAAVAQSRERAVSANLALERNPDLARALAVEAAAAADTPEAAVALRQALEATHVKAELAGSGAAVAAVAADPEGEWAATGDDEGTVTVWELAGGEQAATLDTGDEPVNTVAFDAGGRRLVAAAGERAVLWAPDSDRQVALEGHRARVWAAAFDPDGRRIVTAGADGTARVWTSSGRELARFEGHPKAVFTAAFSPDGRRVASGGREDDFVHVWDPDTGAETARVPVRTANLAAGQRPDVNAVAFAPDGERLLTGAQDGFTRLHSLQGGETAELASGEQEVYGVAFRRDGRLVASAALDGKVRIWDVSDYPRRDPELVRTLLGHGGGVNGVAFVPASRDILSASADGTTRVWEATSDDSTLTLDGHTQGILGVTASADGQTAVTTSLDETARLWDLRSGEELLTIAPADRGVPLDLWSPALSAGGERLLAAVGDGTARIWDAGTGEELVRFEGHRFRAVGAALSPDGTFAVTAAQDVRDGARSWDVETGAEIAAFGGHRDFVFSADVSPDSQRVVTGGADRAARVWDPATAEELGALEGHTDWVRDARFSPDGSRIVTASEDATARVWDAETFEPLHVLRGHEEGVLAASFSQDGERIATASSDLTLRIWDADGGELLDVLEGHADWVNDLAFTPSGEILTASYDDTAKLMACELCVPTDGLVELAEETVPYELTAEEREQYLHE